MDCMHTNALKMFQVNATVKPGLRSAHAMQIASKPELGRATLRPAQEWLVWHQKLSRALEAVWVQILSLGLIIGTKSNFVVI